MTLSSRSFRRLVIAVIFLAVFFLFGYGTKKITQAPPTCTDGIQNGEEEGVDCGLSACGNYCEPDLFPPQIKSAKLIKAENQNYDFVAEIFNPNSQFGASEVIYDLTISGDNNQELFNQEGKLYVLPSLSKFLIITAIKLDQETTNIDLNVKSVQWQRLDSLEGMNFIVRNQEYTVMNDGSSALDGLVVNDSDFDFSLVDIDVILYNSRGEIIAVNRSDVRTLLARTERHFRVFWPFPIKERVAKTKIFISTNLFENLNFIKRYGSEIKKFQEY